MVFNDNVDIEVFGKFGEFGESSDDVFCFLVTVFSATVCVYADGVAAEELCGFDPFFVLIYGLLTFFLFGCADVTFTVDHDEYVFDAFVTGAFFEFCEVCFIFGPVLEKAIYIFNCCDSELVFGIFREVHVGEFFFPDGVV